jgi:hypothetical protein
VDWPVEIATVRVVLADPGNVTPIRSRHGDVGCNGALVRRWAIDATTGLDGESAPSAVIVVRRSAKLSQVRTVAPRSGRVFAACLALSEFLVTGAIGAAAGRPNAIVRGSGFEAASDGLVSAVVAETGARDPAALPTRSVIRPRRSKLIDFGARRQFLACKAG